MSYKKAEQVLPQELVTMIQQYVDGACLYIPRKEDERRPWGNSTKTREELDTRNRCIYEAYLEGVSCAVLSEQYCLSIKSVQRIVLQMKHTA